MIRFPVIITLLGFAAASTQVSAVDPHDMRGFAATLFDRMDLDGDGILSGEEHDRTQGGGFLVDYGLLDLDTDGSVTKDEYLEAVGKYHGPSRVGEPI